MKKERFLIDNIPAIIWGEKQSKVFIAVHGNRSNKEDEVISLLAECITEKGYTLLSFDLPEHGERKGDANYLCNVKNCIFDLQKIMRYAKENFKEINLWACSMGAYFSLIAYKNEKLNNSLFLSPIVNMKELIDNMMKWASVTEKDLFEKQEIKTDLGQTLYWDYYNFVKNNPICEWNCNTYILYGKKDNLQDEKIIKNFASDFSCNLIIMNNGEHYFHTESQLDFYKKWLNQSLVLKDSIITTKRMKIYPISIDEMKHVIENEKERELKMAYQEMLDGCLNNPLDYVWHALWFMKLKNSKNEIVGNLSFKGIDKNRVVEIGYGTNAGYENNGYMTEAVSAVVDWASKQKDVTRIEAEVEKDNIASIRVLQKCNFEPTGEMGKEGIRFVWKG